MALGDALTPITALLGEPPGWTALNPTMAQSLAGVK
ncbi:hypothetical protein BN381_400027 [Candidatus Microthrix parvicella RN1]|uniref:Uncharacterized protein n=1 Tax=Candidatus Neomicrothrix parvicella RN1 TaxID=1229780 RepID=R4Z0Q2_9ACTN|nr:hypothetical protein BN381_400027 [Candidatus Microthrix parvicella RN1]